MNTTPDAEDAEEAHSFFNYERFTSPIQPRRLFIRRMARTTFAGCCLLAAALGIGMIGYKVTEHMSWLDAFSNASMILSGMGPLGQLNTPAGKLFAGCYALFSGLAFITIAGLILSPVVHRFFHRFHIGDEDRPKKRH